MRWPPILCAVYLLLAPVWPLHADPPLPNIPATNFDITSFGAYGNGVSNNASAIQQAINAAGTAGGGTVVVSAVGILTNYLSGPITLTNSVSLQINPGTKLQMLPYGSYPGNTSFITGSKLHDVEISGSGTIDGQGAAWWSAFAGNTNLARPSMIKISGTTRVLVQGVTLQNPPMYHLVLADGNVGATVQNLTINTYSPSPNTDGIDLGATNCLIQNCYISDGDDNISLKPSSTVSADIVISNCTFGTGHGVSVGSGTTGGLRDMTVSNCTFNGTDNGIRMKSDRDRGGLVENLRYIDITMTNVANPLIIYSYYNSVGTPTSITPFRASTDTVHSVTNTTPIWRNITISNLTASANSGKNIVGIIWGLPEMLVSNVTFCNVTFSSPKTFCIYNARAIRFIDSQITAPSASTNTLTLFNADVTVTNSTPSTNVVTLGGLTRTGTNNTLAFFGTRATVTDTNVLGSGSITLNDSTLSFKPTAANFSNAFLNVVSSSTLAFTNGATAFGGTLSGSGALTLNLPASTVLTLRGNSSAYSGALSVSNSGTLLVNNTAGTGTGTGPLTVLAGTTLGGNGVIGGPVTVNGTLAPGTSPGTLTISNNLVIDSGAVLQYELGATSDKTVVSGDLTVDGTLNVTDAGGFTNTTYTLFTYGGTLTDNGLTVGTTPTTNFTYTVSTLTAHQVNLVVSSEAAPPLDPFVAWQLEYFGCTNLAVCPQAAGDADADGDGMSNTNEFLVGTDPTNAASAFRITSIVSSGMDVVVTWSMGPGKTNALQETAGAGGGNYQTNGFTDIFTVTNTVGTTTNYDDAGAATNFPARYYRVRLVP